MTREFIEHINSCFHCPYLNMVEGFADHSYECPHFGISSKTDGSNEEDYKVELQLKEWFENCPKWRYIGE